MLKTFIDGRGWRYCVMANKFRPLYKAHYLTENCDWRGVPGLPWRDNFQAAQEDLDHLAAKSGWSEILENAG